MGITMIIAFWYVRRYAAHKSKLRTLTRRSFCITDLEDVLAADTDYPIIQIIY
jgi:hypothetical protein